MNSRFKVVQLAAAVGSLVIGTLVYVFDRNPASVYFLSDHLSLNSIDGRIFGIIGNHLPTFVHVYAFILLTVVVAVPSICKLPTACLAWFTIDGLFEVAQINQVAQWIGNNTPQVFNTVPLLNNLDDYFLHGTFDVIDVLSIALGTLAAYLTVVLGTRGGHDNVIYIQNA